MSDLFGNHIVGFPTKRLINITVTIEPLHEKTNNLTDIYQPVQSQNQVRILKFQIEEEALYCFVQSV